MTLIKEMFLNQLYGDIDEPELKITSIFFFGAGMCCAIWGCLRSAQRLLKK